MIKMNKKIIIYALALMLTLSLALALGVRPAQTTIISDESKTGIVEIWVVNNDQREFTVKVYLEGEMSQYITLETEELAFRADDDAKPIRFIANLPDSVPPGVSTANVVIEEGLPSLDANVISSKVVLKHKVVVQGPYPDLYLKPKLNFHDRGEYIEFVSEVKNLGKKDIQQVQTKFYVNDKQQQAHTLETETTSLQTKENKLLTSWLEKDLFELGEFEVSAVTTYDGQTVEMIKSLLVGRPEVDITYFDEYFQAYKINEYTMDLQNKWNKEVKNVYVDVEVKRDEQEIDEFRTKSVDIEGLATERVNDYFDVRDKSPGKITFEMIVNFWNTYQMDKKIFQGELLTEEQAQSIVGKAFGPGKSFFTSSAFSIILTAILLVAVAIFIFYRFNKKRKEEF